MLTIKTNNENTTQSQWKTLDLCKPHMKEGNIVDENEKSLKAKFEVLIKLIGTINKDINIAKAAKTPGEKSREGRALVGLYWALDEVQDAKEQLENDYDVTVIDKILDQITQDKEGN